MTDWDEFWRVCKPAIATILRATAEVLDPDEPIGLGENRIDCPICGNPDTANSKSSLGGKLLCLNCAAAVKEQADIYIKTQPAAFPLSPSVGLTDAAREMLKKHPISHERVLDESDPAHLIMMQNPKYAARYTKSKESNPDAKPE